MTAAVIDYWNWVRQDMRLLRASALLLLGLLAYSLLNTVLVCMTNKMSPVEQAPLVVQAAPPQINIAQYHLFGIYSALTAIPKTELQLTLQGIGFALSGSSEAIVSAPGQVAKVYHLGQVVPGGATVNKIERQRIILNDNGRLESLNLPIHTVSP